MSRLVATDIGTRGVLELLDEPELSVVLFRRLGWTDEQYHAWSDRMLAEQRTFTVPTTVKRDDGTKETVLRFCFTHPRTSLADVQDVLDTLN
jgi:glutamate/tyrosine decarboxylase-like PLP-dependent enzyme